MVEQKASRALGVSNLGYVMHLGKVVFGRGGGTDRERKRQRLLLGLVPEEIQLLAEDAMPKPAECPCCCSPSARGSDERRDPAHLYRDQAARRRADGGASSGATWRPFRGAGMELGFAGAGDARRPAATTGGRSASAASVPQHVTIPRAALRASGISAVDQRATPRCSAAPTGPTREHHGGCAASR
jgi:hypothetical protein